MVSKQILPHYVDNYSKNISWSEYRTEHYLFHFVPDSVAAKEIQSIVHTQENAFLHISKALNLECDTVINYYFYPTENDKESLMGDGGNAQAIWHDFSIHAVYNEIVKAIGEHEDTHLLTLVWNDSPVGFFQEGLAEYMSGCVWKNQDATPYAQIAVKKLIYSSFSNLFSHAFWTKTPDDFCAEYYSLAGIFNKFLFEKFGLEKYRIVYSSMRREFSQERNIDIFEKVYGKVELIEKDFYKYLGL